MTTPDKPAEAGRMTAEQYATKALEIGVEDSHCWVSYQFSCAMRQARADAFEEAAGIAETFNTSPEPAYSSPAVAYIAKALRRRAEQERSQ